MNKDEEYVRSVWEGIRVDDDRFRRGNSRILVPHSFKGGTGWFILSANSNCPFEYSNFRSEPEAWAVAAEFTRSRVEQVRQLREAHNKFRFMCSALAPEEWATMEPVDKLAKAELARLTAGMKPEALA